MASSPHGGKSSQHFLHRHRIASDLGRRALRGEDPDWIMHDAAAALAETLEADRVGILELDNDGHLSLREGVGWPGDGHAGIRPDELGCSDLGEPEAVPVGEGTEQAITAESLADDGLRVGLCVPLFREGTRWGLLAVYREQPQGFSPGDRAFTSNVAHVLTLALDDETEDPDGGALERLRDPALDLDPSGSIRQANAAARRLFPAEDPGQLEDAFGRQQADDLREVLATAEQEERLIELHLRTEKGQMQARLHPHPNGATLILKEVTDGGSSELDLRESEVGFRRILKNVDEVVWMTSADPTDILYVNPAFEEIWGRPRQALYEEHEAFLEAIHPDDRDRVRAAQQRMPADGLDEEFRIVTPEGRTRWIHATATPVDTEEDSGQRIVGTAEDVTDHVTFERKLTDLHACAREFLDARTDEEIAEILVHTAFAVLELPLAIAYVWDEERELLIPMAVEGWGTLGDVRPLAVETSQLEGRAFLEGTVHAFRPGMQIWERFLVGEEPPKIAGQILPMGEHGILVLGSEQEEALGGREGQMAEILSTNGQAAYDRVAFEERLSQEKRSLEMLVQGVEEYAIFMLDTEGHVQSWNSGAERIKGYSEEEIVDRHFSVFYTEADREDGVPERNLRQAVEQGSTEDEGWRVRKDGSQFWANVTITALRDEEGKLRGFSKVTRDMTDRHRREQRVEESRRTLVENFPNGSVALVGEDMLYRIAGGTPPEGVDVPVEEMRGRSVAEVLPGALAEQLLPAYEAAFGSAESSTFEIEDHGHTYRYHVLPVRDDQGEVFAAMAMSQDITELRERQHRLEEFNERLEQFAYAASHDLQEPLRMITTYLQLIEDRYGEHLDEEGREFFAYAVDGAKRMRNMVRSLLEYSRITSRGQPLEPTDAQAVLDDVLTDLHLRVEETGAEVTHGDLPRVHADPDQLAQVFRNLIGNALQYSGDEPPRVHVDASPRKDEWVFSVHDEGIGIAEEHTDRIFEVFRRLEPSGSGTGVGLAICDHIVGRHGGEMWVESEPGEGSTFFFTLPRALSAEPE